MSDSFGIYVRVASGLVVGNSLENSWVSRIVASGGQPLFLDKS